MSNVDNETTRKPTSGRLGQPYHPEDPNYPLRLWWIAGYAEEVSDGKLLARKLLNKNLVFYRKSNGQIVAIEDRCIHRGAPLSLGWLDNDQIVCVYHGFRYDADGKLVEIPTQEKCPRAAKLDAFKVVARGPFMWIWMGDPADANEDDVPEFAWLHDEKWVFASEHMLVKSNYMLLKENVLDLTHFPFAHKSTFGTLDDYASAAKFSYQDNVVTFQKDFLNQPLSKIYDRDLNLGGKPVDRTDLGKSMSPAEHRFVTTIKDPENGNEYQFRFQHLTTPETNVTHHYWWVISRNYGLDPDPRDWFKQIANEAFSEDKAILEAIQARINEAVSPLEMPEVSAVADQGGLMARRQLKDFMSRDHA